MKLSSTAKRAVDAYGGATRWKNAQAVEIVLSAWGWAFRLKRQRPFDHVRAYIEISRPYVRLAPIDRDGNTGILDGANVRIETPGGLLVESRANPREYFPGGRRLLWWDRLDQAYFCAYALWNYATLPALLLREDISWTEPASGTLEAHFPPCIPTHSEVQRFHFDPQTGLLRQHDYTAEVFGGWAKAAHVVTEHAQAGNLTFTSKRRVTPRRKDGSPRKGPLLVGIEFHEWHLL